MVPKTTKINDFPRHHIQGWWSLIFSLSNHGTWQWGTVQATSYKSYEESMRVPLPKEEYQNNFSQFLEATTTPVIFAKEVWKPWLCWRWTVICKREDNKYIFYFVSLKEPCCHQRTPIATGHGGRDKMTLSPIRSVPTSLKKHSTSSSHHTSSASRSGRGWLSKG